MDRCSSGELYKHCDSGTTGTDLNNCLDRPRWVDSSEVVIDSAVATCEAKL